MLDRLKEQLKHAKKEMKRCKDNGNYKKMSYWKGKLDSITELLDFVKEQENENV